MKCLSCNPGDPSSILRTYVKSSLSLQSRWAQVGLGSWLPSQPRSIEKLQVQLRESAQNTRWRGWRESSAVENIVCPSREPKPGSHHPCQVATNTASWESEALASMGICTGAQAHMCKHTHNKKTKTNKVDNDLGRHHS